MIKKPIPNKNQCPIGKYNLLFANNAYQRGFPFYMFILGWSIFQFICVFHYIVRKPSVCCYMETPRANKLPIVGPFYVESRRNYEIHEIFNKNEPIKEFGVKWVSECIEVIYLLGIYF